MSRLILRDILILFFIGTIMLIGTLTFMTNLAVNNNITLDPAYDDIYQQFNDSSDDVSVLTSGAVEDVEGSAGVQESTVGGDWVIAREVYDTTKTFVTVLPGLFITFTSSVGGVFGIPPEIQAALIGIILTVIVFTVISLWFRKDA